MPPETLQPSSLVLSEEVGNAAKRKDLSQQHHQEHTQTCVMTGCTGLGEDTVSIALCLSPAFTMHWNVSAPQPKSQCPEQTDQCIPEGVQMQSLRPTE